MCLLVHATVELHFPDRLMMLSGIGNDVVIWGRVDDAELPVPYRSVGILALLFIA